MIELVLFEGVMLPLFFGSSISESYIVIVVRGNFAWSLALLSFSELSSLACSLGPNALTSSRISKRVNLFFRLCRGPSTRAAMRLETPPERWMTPAPEKS